MYKHVNDLDSQDWEVIDLNKNKKIQYCQCADDETGEYCVLITDKNGDFIYDNLGKLKIKLKKGNIKIIKK